MSRRRLIDLYLRQDAAFGVVVAATVWHDDPSPKLPTGGVYRIVRGTHFPARGWWTRAELDALFNPPKKDNEDV